VLRGVRASDLESLQAGIAEAGVPPEVLCVDLSLGAWRGFQAANELAGQLGLKQPAPEAPIGGPAARAFESWVREGYPEAGLADILLTSADSIGQWIDSEAQGDRARHRSRALTSEVLEALEACGPRTLLILAPGFGLPWEREDILFLELLQQGLRSAPSRLLLAATVDSCTVPEGWTIKWLGSLSPAAARSTAPSLQALVPGLLDEDLRLRLPATADEALLPLPCGHFLVEPRLRRAPAGVSRLVYDRLAATVPDVGWLSAYAQFHGNNLHVDSWMLCREAIRRLGEGGDGIALRVQDRAVACAPHQAARAFLECMARGWRIALQRYSELAALPDPSPALPAILRGALAQTKGWGLVMLGQAQRAEPCMNEALELLRPYLEGRREYLYLMNIAALNRVNLGDVEGALAAEREIESRSARLPTPDARFEYVNAINLARLARKLGNHEEAQRYYDRAFATTWGVRSQNDLIYTNVCRARLETARGRHEEAFFAWLRAALHWAAASAPEALGWRAASALLGRRPALGEEVSEAVSATLVDLLLAEARHGRPELRQAPEADEKGWVFLRSGELPPRAELERLAGEPGWGVITTAASASPAVDGPAARRLRALLGGFVRALEGTPHDSPAGLVVIDDRVGRELPATFTEAVETALRLRVPRLRYRGVEVELPVTLQDALECELWARRASAVERVLPGENGVLATFRRYLPPSVLNKDQANLLAALEDAKSVEDLLRRSEAVPIRTLMATLRTLESARVVELRFPESAGIEARLAPALKTSSQEDRRARPR